jgi:hypothetical protein
MTIAQDGGGEPVQLTLAGNERFVVEQASSEAILDFIRGSTILFYKIASREGFDRETDVTGFWLRKIETIDKPLYFVQDTQMANIVGFHGKAEAERQAAMYEALAITLGQDFRNPPGRGSHWHSPKSSISLYKIASLPDRQRLPRFSRQ